MIEKLGVLEVKLIAHRLAKEHLGFDEPIPEFESRFPNILESSLAVPFQHFSGKPVYKRACKASLQMAWRSHELYKGLIGKAAILFYLMIKNHPFQNGNKRVAMTTLLIFFYKNKKWLKVSNQELYNFAVWVAQSPATLKDEVVLGIEKFLKKYMVNI